MVDNRTNFAKEIAALLRETYGSKIKVFGTEIPHSVRAKEISAEGKSIFAHDPNGKVAEGYKNLTKEVIKLEKQREKSRNWLHTMTCFLPKKAARKPSWKKYGKSRCLSCILSRYHPFKVKDDEAYEETADSVRQYGILVPAIARPDPEGGYELVAGHRRHGPVSWPRKKPCRSLSATWTMMRHHHHGGQQLATGEPAPQREGLCLQDEAGGYEAPR